jgi:hypothetical protein
MVVVHLIWVEWDTKNTSGNVNCPEYNSPLVAEMQRAGFLWGNQAITTGQNLLFFFIIYPFKAARYNVTSPLQKTEQ